VELGGSQVHLAEQLVIDRNGHNAMGRLQGQVRAQNYDRRGCDLRPIEFDGRQVSIFTIQERKRAREI
jgi:hypothetical protein